MTPTPTYPRANADRTPLIPHHWLPPCASIVLLLAGCVSPPPTNTPVPHTTAISTHVGLSPTPTETLTPSPMSPTPTNLPAHVYSFGSRPWPESGDLLVEDGDNPEFALDVNDLAAGDYLVIADRDTRVASLYSMATGDIQTLLVPDLAEDAPEQTLIGEGTFVLASREPAGYWRLYDLRAQASWGLGPICRGAFTSDLLSSDGEWIGTVCHEEYQMDGIAFEHVLVQFLSTRTGTGQQFVVPAFQKTRYMPRLTWNSNGSALISRVWIKDEYRACAISPEQGSLYCPPLGLGDMVALLAIDPEIPWITVAASEERPNPKLVPRDCFEVGKGCGGIVEVSVDKPITLLPTADPEIVWWIELRGPDPTSEFGLVNPITRESTELASLGGDYFVNGACPDRSCLFLHNPDGETHWQLSIDGSLAMVPIGDIAIIGAFSIP